MNVAQLMQLLSNYPAETEILIEGYETGYDPVHSITLKTVAGVMNPADYDGLFDTPDNLATEPPNKTLSGVKSMVRTETGERFQCLLITGQRGHRR
tara:strand:- start:99 stop:386 length:288 start_codon:yes stop_codon:yes gene_type:complete